MNFTVEELSIPGAKVLRAPVRGDGRGAFIKTFHLPDLHALGIDFEVAEQYYSTSQRGVVRGMHFQLPPDDHGKLVHCSRGRALDALVDLRVDSPTYRSSCTVDLDGMDGALVYMPRGVGHGFQARTDDTVLHYAVTSVYSADRDAGVRWDTVGVQWDDLDEPIISERDTMFPTLDEFDSPFRMDA